MKNLAETALYFNYGSNHFYVMKSLTPEKFKYICTLDDEDFMKAFIAYRAEMEDVKFKLQDIYYILADDRQINQFSLFVAKYNIFKHPNHINAQISSIIFSSKVGFHSHNSYLKYKKLIPLFDEFIKEQLSI